MSEHTDEQRKKAQYEEKLNKAYRDLFRTDGVTHKRIAACRELVLKDIEAIIYGRTHVPDREGRYCHIRADLNEGGRLQAKDMHDRIYSTPNQTLKKLNKIKVEK